MDLYAMSIVSCLCVSWCNVVFSFFNVCVRFVSYIVWRGCCVSDESPVRWNC